MKDVKREGSIKLWSKNVKERDPLGDLRVDSRKILIQLLKE
jgi:hypothetical protein